MKNPINSGGDNGSNWVLQSGKWVSFEKEKCYTQNVDKVEIPKSHVYRPEKPAFVNWNVSASSQKDSSIIHAKNTANIKL